MERYQRLFNAYWKLRRWFLRAVESHSETKTLMRVLDKIAYVQQEIRNEIYIFPNRKGGE